MRRFFDLLARALLMMGGYCAAALCASAALHLLTLPALGFDSAEIPMVMAGTFVFSVPFVALFVAYFAFVPVLAVIAIAELWSLRSWIYHVAAGGMIGFGIAMRFRALAPEDAIAVGVDTPFLAPGNSILDPRLALVLVLSGMAGGLAYWLVAGRSSAIESRKGGAAISPGRSES